MAFDPPRDASHRTTTRFPEKDISLSSANARCIFVAKAIASNGSEGTWSHLMQFICRLPSYFLTAMTFPRDHRMLRSRRRAAGHRHVARGQHHAERATTAALLLFEKAKNKQLHFYPILEIQYGFPGKHIIILPFPELWRARHILHSMYLHTYLGYYMRSHVVCDPSTLVAFITSVELSAKHFHKLNCRVTATHSPG